MVLKVKHSKGSHYCNISTLLKIYYVSLFKRNADIEIEFSEDSKYTLDNGDQHDWNKIIGRGGLKYRGGARKEEQFLVWRYLPKTDEFQVTEYWRENYEFNYLHNYKVVKGEGVIKTDIKFLFSILPLGGYFGGNRTAPRNLSYKIIVK